MSIFQLKIVLIGQRHCLKLHFAFIIHINKTSIILDGKCRHRPPETGNVRDFRTEVDWLIHYKLGIYKWNKILRTAKVSIYADLNINNITSD